MYMGIENGGKNQEKNSLKMLIENAVSDIILGVPIPEGSLRMESFPLAYRIIIHLYLFLAYFLLRKFLMLYYFSWDQQRIRSV